MERMHINERGSHTTVIDGSRDILKILKKIGVEISPGVIETGVGARGKSIKLKRLNSETFEMVVVMNGSKQTFKVYGKQQDEIINGIMKLKHQGWNIPDVMDLSGL